MAAVQVILVSISGRDISKPSNGEKTILLLSKEENKMKKIMFKKLNMVEKITFVIVTFVLFFVLTSTNIPDLIRNEVKKETAKISGNGNYWLNRNWAEMAIHDDNGDIISYWEAWAGYLGEDADDYINRYWKLAPEGVNENNFEELGYDRLVIVGQVYEETGRCVVGE